jgi:hypothetical protein
MKTYLTEREGQIAFFDNFRIDYQHDEILIDNTDGVYKGCLFEFKLNINNLNAVLFQAIKYLSKMRVKGESVPGKILLVSLNNETCYVFKAEDYFTEIHEIYYGGASKNNADFIAQSEPEKIDYSNDTGAVKILDLFKTETYLKIDIDENCVVGWAERYYREHPKADKGSFLGDETGLIKIQGEIRQPYFFKDFINPYKKETNERFKYLMDKLNDKLRKKELGAFYTPVPYCKKAAELLRKAVALVPGGNDYVIIDRCAGTGNLESVLTDEELSHCILSTYEYYEYKVLCERLADKVRFIIPPTENNVRFSGGCVQNADAMSAEYINNASIKQYLDDTHCTVIMLENPPYSEVSTIEVNKSGKSNKSFGWKNSFVLQQMKTDVSGKAASELANQFIWSAFKFFLRQPTDSYILFSPVKYWKSQHLIDRQMNGGFICNKKHFHASPSAVSCIWWQNIMKEQETFVLPVYDINDKKITTTKADGIVDGLIDLNIKVSVKKVHHLFSEFSDKRAFVDDTKGIRSELNGAEYMRPLPGYISGEAVYNKNIIGYLVVKKFSFENPRLTAVLTRTALYCGGGFYLREDTFMEKLPLFCATKYPIETNWWENGIIYKSFDGGDKFTKDKAFLQYCLVFTCLSYYNKCRSFRGSDGRDYRNALCFDTGTIASAKLAELVVNPDEQALLDIWQKILQEAAKCKNHNAAFTYGVYQISAEINTYEKDESGEIRYDYPELNGDLQSLREKLKAYYAKYITPKLFEYELLK